MSEPSGWGFGSHSEKGMNAAIPKRAELIAEPLACVPLFEEER
jgi:hypothetical protein